MLLHPPPLGSRVVRTRGRKVKLMSGVVTGYTGAGLRDGNHLSIYVIVEVAPKTFRHWCLTSVDFESTN